MGKDHDDSGSWIDGEIESSGFGDSRLGDQLRKLMECLDSATGQPLPLACEGWANTKAEYRFLSNNSVGVADPAGSFSSNSTPRRQLRGHRAGGAGHDRICLSAIGGGQHRLHPACEQRAQQGMTLAPTQTVRRADASQPRCQPPMPGDRRVSESLSRSPHR